MPAFAFDPTSRGARRLARDWAPQLERWEMRVPEGHLYREGDGNLTDAGGTIEVGAPAGRRLAQQGYELVSIRRVRPGE